MNNEELVAHKRRLSHLRTRAAIQGINTPPEISIEIEDIVKRIGKDDLGYLSENSITDDSSAVSIPKSEIVSSRAHVLPSPTAENKSKKLPSSSIQTKESELHNFSYNKNHHLLSRKYQRKFSAKFLQYVLSIFFLVCGFGILASAVLTAGEESFLLIVFGVAFTYYGINKLYREYMKGIHKVIVNPEQIEIHQTTKHVILKWEDIEYFQYKSTYKSISIAHYSLKGVDDTEILLWPSIINIEELAVYIRRQISQNLLPVAVDLYNSGQSLTFGRFSIDGKGIDTGEEIIHWRDINYVYMDQEFYIHVTDREKEDYLGDISEIPNIFLYRRLVYYIVNSYK